MQIGDIKQGSRITYAIGEAEYEAVALGSITTGFNNAIKSPGFFLTLRYLNEQGSPITVYGAPLLGHEADIIVARFRLDADPRSKDASPDDKDDIFDAYMNEIKANPRTTGWHLREADSEKRPEPKLVQPAPDHELAQMPRDVPPAVLGLPVGGHSIIYPPLDVAAVAPSSASLIMQTGFSSVDPEADAKARYEAFKARQMRESMADAGDPLKADPEAANEALNITPIMPEEPTSHESVLAAMDLAKRIEVGEQEAMSVPIPDNGDLVVSPVFETKEYADGSSATGVAPLPDLSPDEQALEEAAAAAAAEAGRLDEIGGTPAEQTADKPATQIDPAEPTA